jgi:hypothetical protein
MDHRDGNKLETGALSMNLIKLPDGSVEINRQGSIIIVTLIGLVTEALTERLQTSLEAEVLNDKNACILYDSLSMNDPSMDLVFMMQSFQKRLGDHIVKSAIVVPGYRLAFLSRLAFGEDRTKYRVFYNDREEAAEWLNS